MGHCENLSRLNSVRKEGKSTHLSALVGPVKPVNKQRKQQEKELLLHLRNNRELSKQRVLKLLHLLDSKEMAGQS